MPARPRAGPALSPDARLCAGQEIRKIPPACILIVDDERIVALDLARRLSQLGYTIAGLATSGSDVITQALTYHPDLVLTPISTCRSSW
jgi:PleD family two-component response regulator